MGHRRRYRTDQAHILTADSDGAPGLSCDLPGGPHGGIKNATKSTIYQSSARARTWLIRTDATKRPNLSPSQPEKTDKQSRQAYRERNINKEEQPCKNAPVQSHLINSLRTAAAELPTLFITCCRRARVMPSSRGPIFDLIILVHVDLAAVRLPPPGQLIPCDVPIRAAEIFVTCAG